MKKLLIVLLLLLTNECSVLAATKLNIAIADFSGLNVSDNEAVTVCDFFRTAMINLQYFNVLDRKYMELLLTEQRLQLSGISDQATAVKIGKLLSVEKIIVGKVTRFEPYYYMNVQVIDVESGAIVLSEKISCNKKSQLPNKSEELALSVSQILSGEKHVKKIDYSSVNPIFLGADVGLCNISQVSLQLPLSRFRLGYRFSPALAGVVSMSSTISENSNPYLESKGNLGFEDVLFRETIKSVSSFALECEYVIPAGRRKYFIFSAGPIYQRIQAEQYFYFQPGGLVTSAMGRGILIPGGIVTDNTGFGITTSGGYKFYLTQDFSITFKLGCEYTQVEHKIDFEGARNVGLTNLFDSLPKSYTMIDLWSLIGVSIDF